VNANQHNVKAFQEQFLSRQCIQFVAAASAQAACRHCTQQPNPELSEQYLADDRISFQHQRESHQMTLALPTLLCTPLPHSRCCNKHLQNVFCCHCTAHILLLISDQWHCGWGKTWQIENKCPHKFWTVKDL